MTVVALSTYAPAWVRPDGARVPGRDEDVTTMAVAAARPVVDGLGPDRVSRVVVVTLRPDVLEGAPTAVMAMALGLDPATPVEHRVGGAVAALDAVTSAGPGTLVIGVDPSAPAGAAAALVDGGDVGVRLTLVGRVGRTLPMRVDRVGDRLHTYDDARLRRERALRPSIDALSDGPVVLVGLDAGEARRLGSTAQVGRTGAAAAIDGIAAALDGGVPVRLLAVEGADALAVDVVPGPVARSEDVRPPVPVDRGPRAPEVAATIPVALPAYDRASAAKLGLLASRCGCGAVFHPPRRWCGDCGGVDATSFPLPRTGAIHTGATIHVGVPGVAAPYALCIVALDGDEVRVLAPLADTPADAWRIGQRGSMVLRRLAVREGIDDYGYAFRPDVEAAAGEVSAA